MCLLSSHPAKIKRQDDVRLTSAVVFCLEICYSLMPIIYGFAFIITSNYVGLGWVLTIFADVKMHKLEIQEIPKLDQFILILANLSQSLTTGLIMGVVAATLVLFLDLLSGRS